jgi:lipopolysaccharide heptosyltransferase II
MKRILVIEPNWLGDVLFTTPAIRALKKANPDAFIGVMAHPRCREMLEDNPNVDRLIAFDEKSSHRGLLEKIFFIFKLRKFKFDTAISFHRSMSKMLIARLAGIKRRVGYYTKKRSWLLTDSIKEEDRIIHRVEYFLAILDKMGIGDAGKDYDFYIPESAVKEADYILENAGIKKDEDFFIINPGGNWPQKRWPEQNYAMLCKKLNASYGTRILITGAEKDMDLASDIIKSSGHYAVNICGKTSLKQLASIMHRAKMVVANDTGPMHIAISQKTPVIALFGPTSPKITGPYGSGKYAILHKWFDCIIPCYKICNDYKCMLSITVEDVFNALQKLL